MTRSTSSGGDSMIAEGSATVTKTVFNFIESKKEWALILTLIACAAFFGWDAAVRSDQNRSEILLRNHVDQLDNKVQIQSEVFRQLTDCRR